MKTKASPKSRTHNSSNTPIFSGEYRVCVCENRITLPTKIYNQLESINALFRLRMTRSPEGCIVVIPQKFWDYYCESVRKGRNSFATSELASTPIPSAETASLKSHRKFTIPHSFMLFPLGDAKKVVVVGLSHWIEIWSEEEWERRILTHFDGK